jgi:hypothetical protein
MIHTDTLTPSPVKKEPIEFTHSEVKIALSHVEIAVGTSFVESAHVGSSYISGKGMDLDLVVQVKDLDHAAEMLESSGYKPSSGDNDYASEFCCFRSGKVNVMITEYNDLLEKFKAAAEVCKALQLLDIGNKLIRIAVHRVLMDHESAEAAVQTARESTGLSLP